VERAATEFRHHLEADTLKVVDRYNKCCDLKNGVQLERQDFISHVQEVESEIRKKVTLKCSCGFIFMVKIESRNS